MQRLMPVARHTRLEPQPPEANMAVHLPLELINDILSEIAEPLRYGAQGISHKDRAAAKEFLSKCALVSHAWCVLAQRHQFQHFSVRPIEDEICQ